jgi:hypothetical protein
MVLELRSDGLYVGGSLLTREAAWTTFANLLGPPSRTNLATAGDRSIYAFDRHGILIYLEKGAGTGSILLDFEGSGGTNGALSPFQGTLKIKDLTIKGDTDSRTLTSMKQLGFKEPGADKGVIAGSYNGLELIFAYWKTPRRLSQVEISLK